MRAHVRAGDDTTGSCTMSDPPSNIDYHVIHQSLAPVVDQACIDLDSQLAPHRPVLAEIEFGNGRLVPVQQVYSLPATKLIGPAGPPQNYDLVQRQLEVAEQLLALWW